jgi:hypothetical protein
MVIVMTNIYRTRRLVLKSFPADDVAARVAEARGWEMYSDTQAEAGETVREVMWRVSPGVSFFYVEGDLSDDCCVGFIARTDSSIDELLDGVESVVDSWSVDDLLAAVDNATGDSVALARAVMRLGLGSPVDFDERFYERLEVCARNSESIVREVAIAAMAYPAWPQLRSVLTTLAQSDPVQNVRDRAADMLDDYDRVGVAET